MALQFLELVSMLIISAALIISIIGGGSLHTVMLPFTLDQMIGASAEELSAVVKWYWWGNNFEILIKDILFCVPILQHYELQFLSILPVVLPYRTFFEYMLGTANRCCEWNWNFNYSMFDA